MQNATKSVLKSQYGQASGEGWSCSWVLVIILSFERQSEFWQNGLASVISCSSASWGFLSYECSRVSVSHSLTPLNTRYVFEWGKKLLLIPVTHLVSWELRVKILILNILMLLQNVALSFRYSNHCKPRLPSQIQYSSLLRKYIYQVRNICELLIYFLKIYIYTYTKKILSWPVSFGFWMTQVKQVLLLPLGNYSIAWHPELKWSLLYDQTFPLLDFVPLLWPWLC